MAFCPNLADPGVEQEFNLLKTQVGEDLAYWLWNRFKGDFSAIQASLRSDGTMYQRAGESPETGLKRALEDESIRVSEKTLKSVASALSARIGMKVQFTNRPDLPIKGRINSLGTAVINLAHATLDTPIHEIVGHPLIRAIKDRPVQYNIGTKVYWQGPGEQYTLVATSPDFDSTMEVTLEDSKGNRFTATAPELGLVDKNPLYTNLLRELEEGTGKRVLDRVKKTYVYKEGYDAPIVRDADGAWTYRGVRYGANKDVAEAEKESGKYTLEEQQEEAIVELLGMYTANRLNRIEDSKLIGLLKRLLREMKQYMIDLFKAKHVRVEDLPEQMTLSDLADLLAYKNSKILLPGHEIKYTTPDGETFETYEEASAHISELAKSADNVDISDVQIAPLKDQVDFEFKPGSIEYNGKPVKKLEWQDATMGEWLADENQPEPPLPEIGVITYMDGSAESFYGEEIPAIFEEYGRKAYNMYLKREGAIHKFIRTNKQYEKNGDILAEWKEVNKVKYDPQEIYDRGQGFYSVIGAYSNHELDILLSNILSHIENNKRAGGEFVVSAFTKPIDDDVIILDNKSKITFVIYPESEDIKWAADRDVYSGSTWDANVAFDKNMKKEVLGVSHTKTPSEEGLEAVVPVLSEVVDRMMGNYNELGIELTPTNFRLEAASNTSYSTRKLIDSINAVLTERYGEIKKPNIPKKPKIDLAYFLVGSDTGMNYKGPYKTRAEAQAALDDYIATEETYEYIDVISRSPDNNVDYNSIVRINDIANKPKYKVTPESYAKKMEEYRAFKQGKSINRFHTDWVTFPGVRRTDREAHENNDIAVMTLGDSQRLAVWTAQLNLEDQHKIGSEYTENQHGVQFLILNDEAVKWYVDNHIEEPVKPTYEEKFTKAYINKKVTLLKQAGTKYPRSFITSNIVKVDAPNNELFEDDFELPFQKVPVTSAKQMPKDEKGMASKLREDPKIAKINLDSENRQAANSHIKELDKLFDLVSIRKFKDGSMYKFFNPVSKKDAKEIKDYIERNYMDDPREAGIFRVEYVTPWTGEYSQNWEESQLPRGIMITGYPILYDSYIAEYQANLEAQVARDREEINKETREDLLPDPKKAHDVKSNEKEIDDIRKVTDQIGDQEMSGSEILDLLDNEARFNDSLKALMSVLKDAVTKFPELKFRIISKNNAIPGYENDLGYYDPNTSEIVLIDENIHNPNIADYNQFALTIAHEFVHAFTDKALLEAETPAQKAFEKQMNKLYELAKKHSDNTKLHAYKNVREFTASVMEDAALQDDLQSLKYNWWARFINAVKELLGIKVDITTAEMREVNSIMDRATQTVLEFIPTQSDFDASGTPVSKRTLSAKQEALKKARYPVYGTIDLNNRKEAVDTLRSIQNEFEFQEGRGTVHKKSNWVMLAVTRIMSQYNLGVDQSELDKDQTLKDAVDRAGAIGKVIHGTIEHILGAGKLNIKNDLGFTSSPQLRKDLSKIVDKFKGQNVTIIPELYVADPLKGIGGKIDMVIIDENNKVHLYDFKTKEKGFQHWTRRFINKKDGTLKYSSRQAADAQLTIYKHIIEETIGLDVTSTAAILIEPEVDENNKITSAKLTEEVSDGVDRFGGYSREGNNIYWKMPNIPARESKFNSFLSGIPGLEDPTRSYYVESKLITLKHMASGQSRVARTLDKLLDGLNEQIRYAERTANQSKIDRLKKAREEILTEREDLDSLKNVLNLAAKDTYDMEQKYFSMMRKVQEATRQGKKEKEINAFRPTIGQLFGWKKSVEAWSGLNDYVAYLRDQIELIDPKAHPEEKKFYEEILAQGEEIMKRVNAFEKRYVEEGMHRLADFLVPYYNRIRAEHKRRAIQSYREEKPKGITEEEYVNKILNEEKEGIDIETKATLLTEMKKASVDIGTLGLWLDNLLDSKDPVTAAMVKAFAKTEHISHIESIKTRDRILDVLRRFEKEHADRGGIVSYQKLYDFMLEKDENGKYTGNFIQRFHSTLWREYDEKGELVGGYQKVVEDTRLLPAEERDMKRAEWKRIYTNFNGEAFQSGKWAFIGDLLADKSNGFTKEHADYILEAEAESKKAYFDQDYEAGSLQDYANSGLIPQELVDAINGWIWEHAWDYRTIKEEYKDKYENKDYVKLQERGGVDLEFYNLMMELVKQADKNVPYSSRLGGRLPGVRKRTSEMIKDNMGIVATVKETMRNEWAITPDDTERDNFEQSGEEKAFLPIHYTGRLEPDIQSYDVPTIVFKFWQSANDFHLKKEILPEMELAKFLIQNRKTAPIRGLKRAFSGLTNKEQVKANNNNLAKQVEEWFQTCVYGRPKKDQGKVLWGTVDIAKLADNMSKYTSLNLLGLNFIQGTANTILGEALQVAENVAGEYMSKKSYARGTAFYMANFPAILGDVGARKPSNIVSLLMQDFDILDEWEGTNFSQRQKYRQAMTTNTLFFTTFAGEHEMQGRFLLSMLSDKRAYDKNGNDIGNMLEMYAKAHKEYKKAGKKEVLSTSELLEKYSDVDLKASEWTEDDQFDFQYKVRGILSRLHGEYSDLGRVAIQRGALGRMAFMFRKFIVPGFKRRWASEAYIERLDDFVEGNYVSMGKFLYGMIRDENEFKFQIAGSWNKLSDHQKANVRRTITEVTFLTIAIIMANFAVGKLKEDDDENERLWSFIAYQALRLKAELLFFTKPDETMSILRSPMASMSVIENLIRLSGQIFHPGELYERGPWKGKPKIYKTLMNMTPGYRQFFRIRDLSEQLSWFSSRI